MLEIQSDSNNQEEEVVTKKKLKTPVVISVIAAAIVFSIAGCFMLYTTVASPEARVRAQLKAGQRYLEEYDYERAIAAFEKAIEIEPKCEEAYIGAADAYLAMADEFLKDNPSEKDREKAEKYYERAEKLLERGYKKTESEMISARNVEVNIRREDLDGKSKKQNETADKSGTDNKLEPDDQNKQTLAQEEDEQTQLSANNIIEVTGYYGNWDEFIQLLELKQEEDTISSEYYDAVYSSDDVYVAFIFNDDETLFQVGNTGDETVAIYGIRIGDEYESAKKNIMDNKISNEVVFEYEESRRTIYFCDEAGLDNLLYIDFDVDENGIIKKWFICNWPEGIDATFGGRIILEAYNMGLDKLEDWQYAYLNWLSWESGEFDWTMAGMDDYEEHDRSYIENAEYQLIYINDDDIPELYIEYGDAASGAEIISYDGEKIISQNLFGYGLEYLERKNLFRNYLYGSMGLFYDRIYTIQDKQFDLVASGEFGPKDISDVHYDSDGNPILETFYWNGELVSESEYQKQLTSSFDSGTAIFPYGEYNAEARLHEGFCGYPDIRKEILSVKD